jgi:membrane protease YdiL (CAAX protease family)
MTTFHAIALAFTALWIAVVVIRFRNSRIVLIGGLAIIGAYAAVSCVLGGVTLAELGLAHPQSWLRTLAVAVGGLAVMLGYSPLADRLATRWFTKPPTLGTFKALQQSTAKLVAGIAIAWVLGGFLEELAFRGIVLKGIAGALSPLVGTWPATTVAVLVAAAGAGTLHLYQGARAAVIVTQLSVLFGVLFLVSGFELWTVILCHGLYDTIAFIRFATRKSRYSRMD